MQLHKVENDLQAKDKLIAPFDSNLEEKKPQFPSIQAEKQSSDAATQFIYSDVVECKSELFHARI